MSGNSSNKKRDQKRDQISHASRGSVPNLTKAQARIYYYISTLDYTNKQIATRLKYKDSSYVRRVRNSLKKMGLIGATVTPPRDYVTTVTKTRRLHAQKFRIEIVNQIPENYLKRFVGDCFRLDNNFVQCFKKSISIQAKNKEFWGSTEDNAMAESMDYWFRFFQKLENQVGVIILKDRKQNITMTYAEWATTPCDLSKECEKRSEKLRIIAKDGKLRYTTDWSSMHEREAHHATTGKQDSEAGNRFIENILDNPRAPLYTELSKIVKTNAVQLNEIALGLNSIVQIIKKQNEQPLTEEKKAGVIKYIG